MIETKQIDIFSDSVSTMSSLDLPSKELLDIVSFKSSFGMSLNKRSLTSEWLDILKMDSLIYYNDLLPVEELDRYIWRVKSSDSIERKYKKGISRNLRVDSVFNDMLSIRIKVPDYENIYPNYFRVVDMRNGKSLDDGYRAVHLYYRKDNFHYQIEIQLWSNEDFEFNSWSHSYGYKVLSDSALLQLRKAYDRGLIKNEIDYKKAVVEYVR